MASLRPLTMKLEGHWSSEDAVDILTPDFVGNVLQESFREMEPNVKMRTLIAFLGMKPEQLRTLKDHLLKLLGTAEKDKEEWVQVAAGLVRRKLLRGDNGHGRSAATADPDALETVLSKTVADIVDQAKTLLANRANEAHTCGVVDTPYSGPLEDQYLSKRLGPPRWKFLNRHFRPRQDFPKQAEEMFFSMPASVTTAGVQGGLNGTAGGHNRSSISSVAGQSDRGPNLARARRTSLMTTADSSAGSTGLRAAPKPMGLENKHQSAVMGGSLSGRKPGGALSRGSRGHHQAHRPGGVMFIDQDELQEIDAKKSSGPSSLSTGKGKGGGKRKAPEQRAGVRGEELAHGLGVGVGRSRAPQQQPPPEPMRKLPTHHHHAQARQHQGGGTMNLGGNGWGGGPPHAQDEGIKLAEGAMGVAMGVELGGGLEGSGDGSSNEEDLKNLLLKANVLKDNDRARLEMYFETPKRNPTPDFTEVKVKLNEEEVLTERGEMQREVMYVNLNYLTGNWKKTRKFKPLKG